MYNSNRNIKYEKSNIWNIPINEENYYVKVIMY